MPAPHRRNKGESLAHHLDTNAGVRKVANDRDNLVAARTRKDAKWEEAAARLDRPASTLEQRAEQARTEHLRADNLSRFSGDVRAGRAKPPMVVLTPKRPPRYYLGACLDCRTELWVHRPTPRVPLCTRCRDKR